MNNVICSKTDICIITEHALEEVLSAFSMQAGVAAVEFCISDLWDPAFIKYIKEFLNSSYGNTALSWWKEFKKPLGNSDICEIFCKELAAMYVDDSRCFEEVHYQGHDINNHKFIVKGTIEFRGRIDRKEIFYIYSDIIDEYEELRYR